MIYTGTIELEIRPNLLVGSDRRAGISADVRPEYAFSSDRALIADQEALELALAQLIRELLKGRRRFFAYPKAHVASVSLALTNVERSALKGALLNSGFSTVDFPTPMSPPARL